MILLIGVISLISALGWRLTRPVVRAEPRGEAAVMWLGGGVFTLVIFSVSVIVLDDHPVMAFRVFGMSLLMTLILAATFRRAFRPRS